MPRPPSESQAARRRMPLRHKLMLALACEVLVAGFAQAGQSSRRAAIVIEVPALAHHVIT